MPFEEAARLHPALCRVEPADARLSIERTTEGTLAGDDVWHVRITLAGAYILKLKNGRQAAAYILKIGSQGSAAA